MSIEAWENRYTVRKFSETNREINPEHLKRLLHDTKSFERDKVIKEID